MGIAVLTFVHVVVSLFLILVVLLQQGKGQDFASTFGGGGTQTSFGARSSTTILHRLTTISAILFMITSLSLTIMKSQPAVGSVIEDTATPVQTTQPAAEPEVSTSPEAATPDAGAAAEEPDAPAPDEEE